MRGAWIACCPGLAVATPCSARAAGELEALNVDGIVRMPSILVHHGCQVMLASRMIFP